KDQLQHAFGVASDDRRRQRREAAPPDPVATSECACLLLRQADASYLWDGVHRRNGLRLDIVLQPKTKGMRDRCSALLHRQRRERWMNYVAGREYRWHRGPVVFV